jgi:cytochrome P450
VTADGFGSVSAGGFSPVRNALLSEDPWTLYEWHRRERPIGYSATRGTYFLFRYEDVRSALASRAFRTDQPFRISRRMFGRTLLDTDGELHDRIRSIVVEPLKPSRVDVYKEEVVQPIVDQVLEARTGGRRIDWLKDVAATVPTRVLTKLFGISDRDTAEVAALVSPLADQVDHGQVALDVVRDCGRRLRPIVDGVLLSSKVDGPLGAALAEAVATRFVTLEEARDNAILLLVAGTATTTSAIANTMACVATESTFSKLASNELAVTSTVKEALRFQPPLRFTPRFVHGDINIEDQLLPDGATVQLCIPSANRDELVYSDPNHWCPERGEPQPALSFGRGLHSCVGAFLGQLEVAAVLRAASSRLDSLALANPVYLRPGWSFRRPQEVVTAVKWRRRPRSDG